MISTSPVSPPPVSVFISYSHKDEDLREELDTHLANLKRQGKIQAWHDRAIEAGTEWDAQIRHQLETAEVVLLLITPRFMASDYCYDLEMQGAIARHDAGTARVIPIILKPVDWQGSPFGKLQVLPKDAKPVTKWADQDEAFLNVVQGIRRAVESLQAKKPTGALPNSVPVAAPSPAASALPQAGFSTYNPQTFTGRDAETAHLTTLLNDDRRIVAIAGMTGIGKTALAERVVANLMSRTETATLPYYRFSLDDRSLTADFSISGAALLRTLGEEPTLADQQDPTNLRTHLLDRLCSQPCRLQIDSLERLLGGNEQEGWSEFCDPLWLDLLHQFLARSHCPSQLLLTSQDIPADLDTVASRYPQFWHCQTLQGLNPEEQQDLFLKLGLPQDAESLETLRRIGAFYDGHPLVLQVIADEIRQPPFQGKVDRYWQHYQAEFTPAVSLPHASSPLARSRLFRRRVRQRVEQTLQRLPSPARRMLCASAVFRRPVSIAFWQAMLTDDDPQAAFDMLHDRNLVEYTPASDDSLLVRQHNLVRSVAYDLLKADIPAWHAAESQAAHLWLTDYEPASNAPNLETLRGYLEASDHYLQVEDYQKVLELPHGQLKTGYPVSYQFLMWGYLRELIPLHTNALKAAREIGDCRGKCSNLNTLGQAYMNSGQCERAIDCFQQALVVNREMGDLRSESHNLSGLGVAYESLGQCERAIDCFQQALVISQEIGFRQGEGLALDYLGQTYNHLEQYEKAIDCLQQALVVNRETGDRFNEGHALGNLGRAYYSLEQYERAIEFHQQHLTIAQELGFRHGESSALMSLGAIQFKLERYSESVINCRAALEIFRETGNRVIEAVALTSLAELHQALDEVEVAQQYCQQALALATELGIPLAAECAALQLKIEEEKVIE